MVDLLPPILSSNTGGDSEDFFKRLPQKYFNTQNDICL
jgi:hypothetical protein